VIIDLSNLNNENTFEKVAYPQTSKNDIVIPSPDLRRGTGGRKKLKY